jgi:hypothetical protein
LVQLMKQLPQPQRGTVLLGVETSCKPMPVRVWAVAHTHMHACTERGGMHRHATRKVIVM